MRLREHRSCLGPPYYRQFDNRELVVRMSKDDYKHLLTARVAENCCVSFEVSLQDNIIAIFIHGILEAIREVAQDG
jgi:hypothetical protein